MYCLQLTILLTKTTAAQKEDALSYYKVRGLYFLAVVFAYKLTITRVPFSSFYIKLASCTLYNIQCTDIVRLLTLSYVQVLNRLADLRLVRRTLLSFIFC